MTTYSNEDVFGAPKAQAEEGAYRARLASVITKDSKKDGSKFRVWTFGVVDAEIVVSGTSSMNLGPESKAYQWASALLGHAPKVGMKLDDLSGRPATIVVARDEKGYAKVTSVQPWAEGQTDAQLIEDEPIAF